MKLVVEKNINISKGIINPKEFSNIHKLQNLLFLIYRFSCLASKPKNVPWVGR
jgi:hypothetical protein